jgi:sporulation protein YlmC with PRC-barrel domain
MRLDVGTSVGCTDGPFGELADVVIDPTQNRVTHLVVQPRHTLGAARLVPVDLAEAADGESEIALRCTVDEAGELTTVTESAYIRMGEVPVTDPDWDVGVEDVLAMPYYSSMDPAGLYPVGYESSLQMTYDRIPKGEVEIRRSSAVISADGHDLGDVEAFLVDGDHITHIVLERGHFWGRRDVTIPISAVAEVKTDAVTLSLTKDEVGALPATHVHRWGR